MRRERERQNLSLAGIADQTRIKQQYLEALERDDFESLPGRFFARSFTTQYAEKLGINTPELQDLLQKQAAPLEIFGSVAGAPAPGTPGISPVWTGQQYEVDPLPEGSASALTARKLTASIVMLAAVIVACGAVFWLWQRSQLSSTSASAPQAERVKSATVEEPRVPVPDTVSPPAAQPTAPLAKVESAPLQPSAQSAAPPAATQVPVENIAAGKISLTVVAKEETWLRITADGKVIVERVLAPGESAVTAAHENARIFLGNAGGVDIRFNGADIGSVGPRGQVRTVEFTPDKFHVVAPAKKPAAEPSGESGTPQPVVANK
ncbi:MAG: DUF4115 domain-containing protein [Bryobacterales bacterium]|nr:DUF4115 domain-containing protein [Bryobacterales bacterium]